MDIIEIISSVLLDGPSTWPRWARRLFVLTLPISLPLWLSLCVVWIIVSIIVGGPYVAAFAVCEKLITLWRDP